MEVQILTDEKIQKNPYKPTIYVYWILGFILFFLIAKEAIVLPLTHDEGNTIHCSTTPFWDIITFKDPVPNNHILNTLFIKFNQLLFGDSLTVARLHNILSFIPFLFLQYSYLKDFMILFGCNWYLFFHWFCSHLYLIFLQ